jgi:hypothetical protein
MKEAIFGQVGAQMLLLVTTSLVAYAATQQASGDVKYLALES